MIVKDESGYLNKIKGESKTEPEVEELNQEDLKKWILALRGDFHYAPKKYVKGDKIEGIENIKWMMKQLINFKYRLKGKHLWDWRHALKILNEEELRIYSVVSRLGLKTEDLEIGLKENWKLMKDIDKHYSNLYNEEPFPDFDKVLWKRINKLIEISHRQED